MSKKKQLNEIAPVVAAAGSAVLRAAGKPLLKYAGKKLFKKAAKAGIKKFGKGAVKAAVNTGKELIKNKAVQAGAKHLVTSGINKLKDKFIDKPRNEEQLVESWSRIVDKVLSK
jgi:hypothetical protein